MRGWWRGVELANGAPGTSRFEHAPGRVRQAAACEEACARSQLRASDQRESRKRRWKKPKWPMEEAPTDAGSTKSSSREAAGEKSRRACTAVRGADEASATASERKRPVNAA